MSVVDEILAHHGVRGMKWGVRRSRSELSPAGAHPDASKQGEAWTRARKGGTKALSDKELNDLVRRMNLEQQYSSMVRKGTLISRGQARAAEIIAIGVTINAAIAFAKSPAGKALAKAISSKV